MERTTIHDRIATAANRGLYDVTLKLWGRQKESLLGEGFSVTEIRNCPQKGLSECKIDFSNPKEYSRAYFYYKIASDEINSRT